MWASPTFFGAAPGRSVSSTWQLWSLQYCRGSSKQVGASMPACDTVQAQPVPIQREKGAKSLSLYKKQQHVVEKRASSSAQEKLPLSHVVQPQEKGAFHPQLVIRSKRAYVEPTGRKGRPTHDANSPHNWGAHSRHTLEVV